MSSKSSFSISGAAALAVLFSARLASAQLELPRPSPGAKVMQQVGLTDITVDYSSPAVKARKIWGGLVPYAKLWRTGANQTTRITFSKDVVVGDKPVPAGTYALFTIPTQSAWTLILNKRVDQPATGQEYKEDQDQARVTVQAKPAPHRERLAFIFNDTTDDKTSLELEWEKLRVAIPIKAATTTQALANIKNAVDGNWRMYANAARYMLDTKDYDAGLKYADQSLALKEDWFNLWIKAQLLAAKGNYKDAHAQADKAYQLGQKTPAGFFLQDEVKKALADWKKKS